MHYNYSELSDGGIAGRLVNDLRKIGFAVIRKPPIPESLQSALFNANKRFFSLPQSIKNKYRGLNGNKQRGYQGFKEEPGSAQKYADLSEHFHYARDDDTPVVKEIFGFMDISYDYVMDVVFAEYLEVAAFVLRLIEHDLELEPGAIRKNLIGGKHVLKNLCYPKSDNEKPGIRKHAHTDLGIITVLQNDGRSGLEVEIDDKWTAIHCDRGDVIVNVGDSFALYTDFAFKSAKHRVITPPNEGNKARFSTAFFALFSDDTVLKSNSERQLRMKDYLNDFF